jgi:Fe-S cluster assembly iron-binding protein IscA
MDSEQQRRTTKNGILNDIEAEIDKLQSERGTGEIVPRIFIKDGGVQGFKLSVEKQKRLR